MAEEEVFEFKNLDKKPEEDEIKKGFDDRAKAGAVPGTGGADTSSHGQGQSTPPPSGSKPEDKVFAAEMLADIVEDTGDMVLDWKYEEPYNKWSDKERLRIRKYSAAIEKKYPWAAQILDKLPEIGLGLTFVFAGLERRGNATPKPKKEKTEKKKE